MILECLTSILGVLVHEGAVQEGRGVVTPPDRWGRDGSVESKDLSLVYTAFPRDTTVI